MIGINCGSGQRPFTSTEDFVWKNVDIEARWNPDIVADWMSLPMIPDNSVDVVVAHHTIEHVGCGEATPFFNESRRILKPGGSLIVCVPDLKQLAARFVLGEITEWIFKVNLYGAYMGDEHDRHKWGYTLTSLSTEMKMARFAPKPFNWREIPGADIARDWWILAVEGVKP